MSSRKSQCTWIAAAMLLLVAAPAWASLSQGFATATPIAAGSLVALDEKSSGSVVVASSNNVGRLFGIVVPPSSASISLSGTGTGQVQVVTTGTAEALVSTIGGPIHVGDYVTASVVAGVGQKVDADSTRVIGTAQSDFDGTGDGVTKRTIDAGGSQKEVSIGQIPIVIAVSVYSPAGGQQASSVPSWLQNLSNTVAGKAVSPVRVITAGLILAVALISVTVLLYAAVRNSLVSIGRNPLSHSAVLRGLLQVVAIAAGILVFTGIVVYVVVSK